MMSPSARREYVRRMQPIYRGARGKKEKSRLIRQVSETLNCHKKHAGRLMRGPCPEPEGRLRRREPVYPERLVHILQKVWAAAQHPWSIRLHATLPLWLPWIKLRWPLTDEEEELLLAMSAATMDRRLAAYKARLKHRIYGQTKPGRWLRQSIPIQTESWNVPEPGWTESDTVSHSGPSASGTFAYTFNQVDLFSGWVESVSMLGKYAEQVVLAAQEMREAMPFEQKGMDTDNGEEFINWELDRYCHKTGLKRFRSRPNKKNDQAHIEQKNGTHVRRLMGWDRYDTQEVVDAMNDLYRNEWRLLSNLFLPSVKLSRKIRVGSRTKRVYGAAKTPLDRLRDSGMGDKKKIEALYELRRKLDPFELARTMEVKLGRIWKLASHARPAPEKPPARRWALLDDDNYPPLEVPLRYSVLENIRKTHHKERLLGIG